METLELEEEQISAIKEIAEECRHGASIVLVSYDGTKKEVSPILKNLLHRLALYSGKGELILIGTSEDELSTQEAADILNVSRPFLVSLLEKGEIPYHSVGTHKRVILADVVAYKAKRREVRRQMLDKFFALTPEEGEDGQAVS